MWNPLDTCSPEQREKLRAYRDLLLQFNRGINLISREDERFIDEHHVLHCLTLTHRSFPPGATVVDWGTGGGLPSIPLAIAFPGIGITAVDAVEKKIRAVRSMARRLGLDNLEAWHGRAESFPGETVYSVSRATAPLVDLWSWHERARRRGDPVDAATTWRPGLICLKGGDLAAEVDALHRQFPGLRVERYSLSPLLGRPYFGEKYILEVFEEEPYAS